MEVDPDASSDENGMLFNIYYALFDLYFI